MSTQEKKYSAKDYRSSAQAKWCPGCGCYPLLKSVTNTFALLNVPKENIGVISGIGCSSRFPYYLDTYGFHTIHGRAPTVATGLKLVRPDLSTWIISGDGDMLSIGGNHFIHLMRRNADINVLLLNNEIYGLTKGQASPASRMGTVTKTTPLGSIDTPMKALTMAIASGATFVARVLDTDMKKTQSILKQAADHKGISFVEILFNCVTFNNNVFGSLKDDETSMDATVELIPGEPLLFGKDKEKAVRLKCDGSIEIVSVNETPKEQLLIHNPKASSTVAYLLSQMQDPVAFGVFRDVSSPTQQDRTDAERSQATQKWGEGQLSHLLRGTDYWEVEK